MDDDVIKTASLGAIHREERVLKGLGVAPGVAIGEAHLRECGSVTIPEYRVAANRVRAECQRFSIAVEKSRQQLGVLRAKTRGLPEAAAEELGYLLDAYQHMLSGSRLVRGVEDRISAQRINAEAALQTEMQEITASFLAVDDAYLSQRADDICAIGTRVLQNLVGAPQQGFARVPKGSIIVADEISPADAAQMDPRRVKGVCAALGGAEGHTAIMARALGLPAVLGVSGLLAGVENGAQIIIDGNLGRVIVNPLEETLRYYERRMADIMREQRALVRLRKRPAVTTDNVPVLLRGNIELPVELHQLLQMGAVGIGLLRSEFMFMNREDLPTEEEQYQLLKSMVDDLGGQPITVRTLDVGGEKIAASLVDQVGTSAESVLGLRGIRLSLSQIDLLKAQSRAILRAGAHGPVRILLPMVTTVSEVRRARETIEEEARSLIAEGIAIADPLPPVGVMIEVPGAALAADALARDADFFAIGSNDLTMYALAIDRTDERVAYLHDPLHPAVLRLIQFSTQAALRAGIPVSLCGEMAGDPRYTALLLGLGIRELSMSAHNIPRVKRRIRELDMAAASLRAKLILEQTDAGRITTLLDDFNGMA
ncbi:phosphoenolpyruvate--protein phosphotransferase [Magnetospira sp. QH-2]|uniref:phosphoenolpyruvate--protein phosphotransferase n=1 Tax=Magnetospira sp. (strain QH-2) TaxID=1288970 RepID=UPI0005FA3734|nr:phosphoenolpyruvate--protein phosphotransferase [Magnetospira sp. QH-2]